VIWTLRTGLGKDLAGFLGILVSFRTWGGGGVRVINKTKAVDAYFHSVSIGPWMTSFNCSGESCSFVCMIGERDKGGLEERVVVGPNCGHVMWARVVFLFRVRVVSLS
jgi:hypothetical protein